MFTKKNRTLTELEKLTVVIEYLEQRREILKNFKSTARQRREIELELNLLKSKKLLLNGDPVESD